MNTQAKNFIKISYLSYWDNTGTFYNQTINIKIDNIIDVINNKIKKRKKDILKNSTKTWHEYQFLSYVQNIKKGINYLTITQRDFICNEILKIKVLNRNTILKIN
jgi:hypothetical protein